MELLAQHFSHRQEIISKLLGSRRKAPRQVHDDIVSHQGLFCWCWLFYIGVLTCLSDDFPIAQTIEQDSISNTPSLDLHVIMEHSLSVTNYYRLISMRKFHSSNSRRRMPRMYNEHVSLYSEETNAENSAGLVVHLYRIVPHIHSTRFSTLYIGKRSAIEILLRKQEPCFSNAWKNGGTWLGKIRRSYLCIDTQPPL